ncbi:uncharacterized protein N7469_003109 [Penicillium citrinum]|uniref:Uncharacterized protein n=1 Tax=Penicillium citrinum TaxID=5077 RepID=A0A9W9PBK5_PENCI|nr:uncharacterized protein N7469_003109 [Penicillium citrinum]KAJ5241518.1 hypothetical protein N7469_003109 [Penicillium citrinum]
MPDTLDLNGKVAVITGSGKETGIGACIASTLARNGALVTINYVSDASAPRAARVAEKIREQGGRATVVQADVSTAKGSKELIKRTLDAFEVDKIDIIVNNAAGGAPHGALQATRDSLDTIFSTIVYAPIFLLQAAVPHMPHGSRIINIGSIASKLGMASTAIYGAAKAAQDSLTYSLAMELGRSHGITVNTVSPGPVGTEALPKDVAAKIDRMLVPMTRAEERLGTTNDIADAVLLLVSEKSRWITGQVISVSGGITGG